jgi:hypothetical protein
VRLQPGQSQKTSQIGPNSVKSARFLTLIPQCEEARINSCFGVGCGDLPDVFDQ